MDAALIISPCVAHITLDAITHNYAHICSHLPSQAEGMCIIKSDAYGHGLVPVATVLHAVGAKSYGVGTVQEGVALRKAGLEQDILILLGALTSEEMQACVTLKLLPLVYNMEGLRRAAESSVLDSGTVRIALKCETGMSRLGFCPEDMGQVMEFLRNYPHIDVALMLTHLACADTPEKESMVRNQAMAFKDACEHIQAAYPHMRRSLCNTAASMAYSELSNAIGANVYRLGIGLYGGNPFMHSAWEAKGRGLREGMQISAPILHVSHVKQGESIGYGALFTAKQDMRVAVLGIGYADGFSRGLSSARGTGLTVSIEGKAAPLCGRVCMGMIMVDVSTIPTASTGQRAWVTHADGFSVQTLAEHWGTIPYEAFCLLGKNTRQYD